MKIGVLIDRVTVGGVEKIAIQEVRAFREKGYDASLIVLSRNYEPPESFNELMQNIPVIHLEDRLPRWLTFSFKMPLFSFFSLFHITYPFYLPFVIKNNELDLIVSHNSYTSFTALALSKRRKVPYALFVHDPISYILKNAYSGMPKKLIFSIIMPVAKYTDRLLFNNAAIVLVQGEDHYRTVSDMMKNRENLFYILPGHDASKSIIKERDDYFILVSAWKEGKKIEDYISALKSHKVFKIKIVGKWIQDSYRKKVENQIKAMGLEQNISLLGEVPESELNELYRHAQANIIYSNEKGYGMSALESAANGCTFIIPKDCGAARCFRDGEDGLFYTYSNNIELINDMYKLLDNNLAFKMGKCAQAHVRKNYSWHNHINIITEAIIPKLESLKPASKDLVK